MDTLNLSKNFANCGFTQPQAEALAIAINDAGRDDHLVTKEYLDDKLKLTHRYLDEKLEGMRIYMDHRFEKMELRLLVSLGAMFIASSGFLAALIKFLLA